MNWSTSWEAPAKPIETAWPAEQAKPFNPWDNMSRDELLVRHQELQQAVTKAKETEMEMRKYIVARAFPEPKEGVNNLDLGNGYTLKAGIKFTRKLDPDNDKVDAVLDRIAKIGNEGAFIADRLIKWTPTLVLAEYRLLEDKEAPPMLQAIKKEIDTILTTDDAAPTLEIKAPKAKK